MRIAYAALAVVQEHGAEGGGGLPGPFHIEPGLIVWTWVVFVALFLLLRKYAWPAILRATEERERTIARQLAEAERQNAEARTLLEQQQALLSGAKQQAQDLIAEAKAAADGEREHLLARARAEQEQLVERARREIEAEKDRAVAALRREAVDLSLAAATKLIGERLDDAGNRRLVEEYLESLSAERQ